MRADLHKPLSLSEIFGLSPWDRRVQEFLLMLRGDPYTPKSRFDTTSLNILRPKLSVKTWMGVRRPDKLIPLYNLFNHTQTPIEEGWSVRVTQVEDYRGRTLTYDSHNGTDFSVPVGALVVAPAPGLVIRVSSEFHRGGLKIFIDHGQGVVTTSNHLGRPLVRPGDVVRRGDPIALAGASGVDMVTMFPWTVPHVHFNVWLNGLNVDPFAREGEVSLWLHGNDPQPHRGSVVHEEFEPTAWDMEAVEDAIAACLDVELQSVLRAQEDPVRRAGDTLFFTNYFPTRFSRCPSLYPKTWDRAPILTLPFLEKDFEGVSYPDEPGGGL